MLAAPSHGKRAIQVPILKPSRLFSPFARAHERTSIKIPSTESRFVAGPLNVLFAAGVYVCTFQPGNVLFAAGVYVSTFQPGNVLFAAGVYVCTFQPGNVLFAAGVYVCTFQPGNFAGCGREGVEEVGTPPVGGNWCIGYSANCCFNSCAEQTHRLCPRSNC